MEILKFIRFKNMNSCFGSAVGFGVISSKFNIVYLRDVLENLSLSSDRKIILDDNMDYQEPTLSSKTNTISISKKGKGKDFKVKNRTLIKQGDLVISKMHTQNGLFAFADTEYHSTSTFIPFSLKNDVLKDYLFILLKPTLARLYKNDSVKRETYKVDEILDLEIPLPKLEIQQSLVSAYQAKIKQAEDLEQQANQIDIDIENYLFETLGIQINQSQKEHKGSFLQFVKFKDIERWDIAFNTGTLPTIQTSCKTAKISELIYPINIEIQNQIANHIQTLKNQQKQAKIQAEQLRLQAVAEFEGVVFVSE